MKPLISIVVPSFNKAAFIQETLQSIKDQNFNHWEALVVEDGSTDNSIRLISGFCKIDPRFKLILREKLPKGGSACRNIGIKHAKADYIMFLDADDVLGPGCLIKRYAKAQGNTEKNFLVFPVGTFFRDIGDSPSTWHPKGSKFLSNFLSHDLPWNIMSVLWKKTLLEDLNGFDPDFSRLQDVELHTRVLLKENIDFSVYPKEEPDCFYRIDENRIISNRSHFYENWVSGVEMYIAKIASLIDQLGVHTEVRRRKLKGTVFSMVTTLLNRQVAGEIDENKFKELSNQLLFSSEVKKLLTRSDYYFFKLYIFGYKRGFYKIKGYNFFSKFFLINKQSLFEFK